MQVQQSRRWPENRLRIKTQMQYVQKGAHLCIELKSMFPVIQTPSAQSVKPPDDESPLQTNFGITVYNPYCFILLHLRNKSNKNPVNVNIPEVCVFHQKTLYDIIYSSKGFIRSHKITDHSKLKLKQINKIFKQTCLNQGLPKNQPSLAVFLQDQVLVLTDSDVLLISCKTKMDPFFKKLLYIRNKIPANDNKPIIARYSQQQQQDQIIKYATQSLQGYQNQQNIYQKFISQYEQDQRQLAENKYLRFLNEKIALYLNYEHNIRIKSCDFIYIKTVKGVYYLVNVTNLIFTNLTNAILRRQKRLLQQQQQRNKILIMTPQKEIRYKSYQHRQHVKTYENIMGDHFQTMVRKMNFLTMTDNKRQQVKNQMAFKRLHPKSKFTYTQVINSSNFIKVKDEILQNSKRKPITIPSKYVLRYYNRIKNPKIKTEVISIDDDL